MPVGLSPVGLRSPTRIIVDGAERLITASSSSVSAVARDGTRLWSRTLETGSVSLWRWGDAVLASDSQRLWLIDAASGDDRFAVDAVGDELLDVRGDNPDGMQIQITGVALSPAAVFVGLGTATIALDPSGERLWRRARPNPRNGVRPPEGAPLAARDRWLVTHDPAGTAVDIGLRDTGNGRLQWLKQYAPYPAAPPPGGGGGAPGPDDAFSRSEGRIADAHIVVRAVQEIRVVALADGRQVWIAASPTPIAGVELVGSTLLVAADKLRAYELATRAPLWEYEARGARVAATGSGTSILVASDEGLSLVDIDGRRLWFEPYPTYLLDAVPDWAGVVGERGYVTFRPRGQRREPLESDVIAVNLRIPASAT